MNNVKLVRNLIILMVIVLFVLSARDALISILFSIVVGALAMATTFKLIFKSVRDSEHFTWDKYMNPRYNWLDLFSATTRKQAILIEIWWLLGILVAIFMCKLLEVLIISNH